MNNYFQINDLVFDIPPTDITVNHSNQHFEWKTLRSSQSAKIPTGQGDISVGLRLVFTPGNLDQLHRLVLEFQNTPIWYVKNRYLKNAIGSSMPRHVSLAFTARDMNVVSVPELPHSFEVGLTLSYFNYAPYAPNLRWRKDWNIESLDGKKRTIYNIEVGEEENIFQEETPFSSLETISQPRYLQLDEQRVDVTGLNPSPFREPTTTDVTPEESDIYRYYINYLQAKGLEDHFGAAWAMSIFMATPEAQVMRYNTSAYTKGKSVVLEWKEFGILPSGPDVAALVKNATVSEEVLAETNSNFNSGSYLFPTKGTVTSLFNPNRFHPVDKVYRPHNGVDIGAPTGTPVVAPIEGKIVRLRTEDNSANGLTVYLQEAGGYKHSFMHLNSIETGLGSTVVKGELIGTVGSTGLSTGPHLHWEVRRNGDPIDPLTLSIEESDSAIVFSSGSSPVPTFSEVDFEKLSEQTSEQMKDLAAQGWHLYKSPHVANVIYRDWKLIVPLTEGEFGSNSAFICTAMSATLGNQIATLPLLSHETPTSQLVGSFEGKLFLNFAALSKQTDDIPIGAKALVDMVGMLQKNARLFRAIPDSWTVNVSCFGSRLIGARQFAVNNLRSDTIPQHPGSYTFDLELTASEPFSGESLQSTGYSTEETMAEIVERLFEKYIKVEIVESRQDSTRQMVRMDPSSSQLNKDIGGQQQRAFIASGDTNIRHAPPPAPPEDSEFLDSVREASKISSLKKKGWTVTQRYTRKDKVGMPYERKVLRSVFQDRPDTAPSKHAVEHGHLEQKGYRGALPSEKDTGTIYEKGEERKEEYWKTWNFKYTVDNVGDEWLAGKLQDIAQLCIFANLVLSDGHYHGLTRQEIIERAPFFGIEKYVLPSYEQTTGKRLINVPTVAGFSYINGEEDFLSEFGNRTWSTLGNRLIATLGTAHKFKEDDSSNAFVAGILGGIGAGLSAAGAAAAGLGALLGGGTAVAGTGLLGSVDAEQIVAPLSPGAKKAKELELIALIRELIAGVLQQAFLQDPKARLHSDFQDIFTSAATSRKRSPCYPDLNLPDHPYFGSSTFTDPDFYFYNYADNAGIEGFDSADPKLKKQILQILRNNKASMDALQDGTFESENFREEFKIGKHFDGSETIKRKSGGTASYESLRKEVDNVEKHFNSKFSGVSHILAQETVFEKDPLLDHKFDIDALKEIAYHSMQDFESRKYLLKRAFPTFKLYFIEEDSGEESWSALDDFYGYNAVRSISLTRSRKIPADLCVVELQNVSGVLDGTLQGAITDLDYVLGKNTDLANPTEKSEKMSASRSRAKEGSAEEDVFNSIILREGMNVQLRLGYSNNPDFLSTVFNGRVVEVHWSNNTDIVTIVCQSYATELVQMKKGISGEEFPVDGPVEANATLSFATAYLNTTDLLSSMIRSPEVMHFGKWQWGYLPQVGEQLSINNNDRTYRNSLKWMTAKKTYDNKVNSLLSSSRAIQQNLTDTTDTFLIDGILDSGASAIANMGQARGWIGEGINAAGELRLKEFLLKRWRSYRDSPADNNIYAPDPDVYIDYGLWDFSGGMDHRQIVYHPKSTTIWDVFQEMTFRHPGWVASPVPYGSRMTMFFGIPSQRYWAEDATPAFIESMNKAREDINLAEDQLGSSALSGAQRKSIETNLIPSLTLYLRGLRQRFKPFRKYHFVTSYHDIVSNEISTSSYNMHNSVAVRYNARTWGGRALDFVDDVSKATGGGEEEAFGEGGPSANSLNIGLVAAGEAGGFVWRSISKGRTESEVAIYKYHPYMADEDILLADLDFENCNGQAMAERYSLKAIQEGLKEMYTGQLTLLGNPELKPYDIVFLMDNYNDMAGPVEVEEVTHFFSPNTGFISVVIPDAVVVVNEMGSTGLLDSMGWAALKAAGSLFGNTLEFTSAIGNPTLNESLAQTGGTLLSGGAGMWAGVGVASVATGPAGVVVGGVIAGAGLLATNTFSGTAGQVLTGVSAAAGNLFINTANFVSHPTPISGAQLTGGFRQILKSTDKTIGMVIPLAKGGIPMLAGIPEDIPENIFDSWLGKLRLWVDDAEEGFMNRLIDFSLYNHDIVNAYSDDLSTWEKWAITGLGDEG